MDSGYKNKIVDLWRCLDEILVGKTCIIVVDFHKSPKQCRTLGDRSSDWGSFDERRLLGGRVVRLDEHAYSGRRGDCRLFDLDHAPPLLLHVINSTVRLPGQQDMGSSRVSNYGNHLEELVFCSGTSLPCITIAVISVSILVNCPSTRVGWEAATRPWVRL